MLPSNPSNHAKQPLKHWQATPSNPEQHCSPIRKTPFPPFSPLSQLPVNATPNPAIIHAVCLSDVINLTNPIPNHNESRPAFHHHLASHCRRSDPIPSHYNNTIATLATRHALYTTSTPHRIGGQGLKGISFLIGGRRRWWVGVYSRDCRLKP